MSRRDVEELGSLSLAKTVVENTACVSLFWSIKDLEYVNLLRPSDLVRARLGH